MISNLTLTILLSFLPLCSQKKEEQRYRCTVAELPVFLTKKHQKLKKKKKKPACLQRLLPVSKQRRHPPQSVI